MPKKHFAKDGPTPAERRWAKVIAAWRGSGQTGTAFCRQRKVKESAFRFWLKELDQRRKARQALPAKSARTKPRRAVRFVPTRLVPTTPCTGDFEIVLAGGRRVATPLAIRRQQWGGGTEVACANILPGRTCLAG